MGNKKPSKNEYIDNLAKFHSENGTTMTKSHLAENLNLNGYGDYQPDKRGKDRVVGARADYYEKNGDFEMRRKINDTFVNKSGGYDYDKDEYF